MRSRIGSNAFALMASYAPTSLIRALTPAENAKVATLIRGSVLEDFGHRLQYLVDRSSPERRIVSTRKLTSAVFEVLDIDAIYALLALRDFDTEWSDTDEEPVRATPLFAAIMHKDKEVFQLLLEHRAAPDGYQFRLWENIRTAASCMN